MTAKIQNLEKNEVKIDITIDKEVAKKAYDSALSRMAQHVNIPGFRKGKAPRNVIEKYVGQERIKVQVIEDLFPSEISKAISENSLELAMQPVIESFTFDLDKDLIIIAKAELKPEVELGKYKEVTVEFEQYSVPENALDLELDAIRSRFSTVKTIEEDRVATDKDLVVIDFAGFVNGEAIERGEGKNYTLDLGHSNFIPGFAEAIVGHKKGEEFMIDVTFPEEYAEEKLKGAAAQFKINLHEIQERILPELNDELAKKIGKFDTAQALKDDITKYLDESSKAENEKRKMEAIFNKVTEEAKIDIQDKPLKDKVKIGMTLLQCKAKKQLMLRQEKKQSEELKIL